MQDAQTYLEVVRSRGERRLELSRVYRNLQNQELFLRAYGKLYANQGALTPGTNQEDTVDGMSIKRIERILKDLEEGTYRWSPSRRVYIEKKGKPGKKRPLGIPNWTDKLLQEALRTVLSAYYEPQFSNASHGFRSSRGCHTALREIIFKWKGTKWLIEGDIKGCFDNIDHNKLLEIMGRNVHDERLLKLVREMLDAGYLEDWKYHQTYSGTPQGGVISPLLANIFLNELDRYVEQVLIPKYTKGDTREENPEYIALQIGMAKAKRQKDIPAYKELKKKLREIPCGDPNDALFRRLKYVRYADDFLLGFIGPKSEAEEIKHEIGEYLKTIGLTLSEEKTLVTHATEGRAKFLGYNVGMAQCNSRIMNKRRTINGLPVLEVPEEIVQEWVRRYTKNGIPHHRQELVNNSDYDIVMTYNMEFQGLVNYYVMAHNVAESMYSIKRVMWQSLIKTLAVKNRQKATWIYKNHVRRDTGVAAIVVEVPREGKEPLVAKFGAKPIHYDKKAKLVDTKVKLWNERNELLTRLLANQCELCGVTTEDLEAHHISKLREIQQRYQGKPSPPAWVIRMIELRRKTLIVCTDCHYQITHGIYDGPKLK